MLDNFKDLRYFTPQSDDWTDASKMSRDLLLKLDEFRHQVGSMGIITSAYRPHDDGSQHALGLAVDIMFPQADKTLKQIYDIADKLIQFKGVGVYPHWEIHGKMIGGVHVDVRTTPKPARWMGIKQAGRQLYVGLNEDNMRKYGVV